MRAVVDTNILVSGLMHSDRIPAQVLVAIAQLRLIPVVCSAVMAEYRRILPRPQLRLSPEAVLGALDRLENLADWVAVPPYNGRPPLPDPTDWPFIACALAAGCPVITGNVKHFPAEAGVRVMTAREWVEASSST